MAKVAQTKKKAATAKQSAKSKRSENKTVDLSDKTDSENSTDSNEDEQEPEKHETKSSFLKECLELFGTKDLYAVLHLEKSKANASVIKRSYYKLSLKFHPDKVTDESKKEEAKTKFQLLGKIYSILSDEEKKKIYDETGSVDGEDEFFGSDVKDWEGYWRAMFKKVSTDDVDKFFETYKNSDEERTDLLRFYEKHEGDMNLILEEMFSSDLIEDEARFKEIINQAIEKGDAKKYENFSNESKKKANKRKANFEKEAKEAEELRKEMGIDESQDSLRKAILSRRKNETDSFLDHLAAKYSKNDKKSAAKGKTGKRAKASKKETDEEELPEEEEEDIEEEEEEKENDSEEETESEEEEEYGKKSRKSAGKSGSKKRRSIKVTKPNGKPIKKVKRL